MVTKKSPSVAVLMAAYNGISWIEEQLNSILGQLDVEVTIFISDDQSIDGTLAWCEEFATREARVVILPVCSNRFGGAAKNFFRLIRDVEFSDFDYVAYADQDDIFLENKYRIAHDEIMRRGCAAYSSNVTAFWPDGRQVLLVKSQPQRKYDFLFEAGGPGCSYVLRVADALEFKQFLIQNWQAANDVSLHDWLTYAWFRSTGRVWHIDADSYMLYRQHGGNQVGANNGFSGLKSRFKLLTSGWYRDEVSKISRLVACDIHELPASIMDHGVLPKLYLLKNFSEFRRSGRDRVAFGVLAFLGLM